jgi:hypothetical protein
LLNLILVVAALYFAVYAIIKRKRKLLFGSGLLWLLQLVESLFSKTYQCSKSVVSMQEVLSTLTALKTAQPHISVTIRNFHWLVKRVDTTQLRDTVERLRTRIK